MKHCNWRRLLARVLERGEYHARYRGRFCEYNMLLDMRGAGLVECRRSYWSGVAHSWLATDVGERWLIGRELAEMEAQMTLDGGR